MKAILIILSITNVLCVKYYDILYLNEYNYDTDNEYNYDTDNDEFDHYEKYLDINYFHDRKNNKIERCPDGETSEKFKSEYRNSCTKCTIFYKNEYSILGRDCIKCPDGLIASTINGHDNYFCKISYSIYDLSQIENSYFNMHDKKLCNEFLINSIGRKENTPPIRDYCQCPNNMPRVKFFNLNEPETYPRSDCLSQELALKYISSDKLDYTIVYFLINITGNNDHFKYRNCNPHRITIDFEFLCLCPPMHIYSNGKCKECTDSEPSDHDKQMKCAKCSSEKILRLDGKGCMCPYSDEPQSKDCNKATENEIFCSGNLVFNEGKCEPCKKNKIKSKTTNQCICAEGKYISSNNVCVNCTNGFTKNDINETFCFCPKGRYIIYDENCIECSRGKFSTTINSVKCNTCPFFKTTENTESKSPSQCNKINYLHLFSILGIIGLIIILCFSITLFIVKKKSKQKNVNNENGNQAATDIPNSKKTTNESKMSKQPQQESYVNYESSKVPINKNNSGPHEYLNQINTSKEEKNSKSKECYNISNQKDSKIETNNEDNDEYQNVEITKIHLKKIIKITSNIKNDQIKSNKSDSNISQEVNDNKISKKLNEEEADVYESCGLNDSKSRNKNQK